MDPYIHVKDNPYYLIFSNLKFMFQPGINHGKDTKNSIHSENDIVSMTSLKAFGCQI